MGPPQLPVELLELVIAHLAGPESSIALPASDVVTKTLHSCLFVSKTTHAVSLEQLYAKCLWIDSPWRLRALNRSYNSQTPVFGRSLDPLRLRQKFSTSMFLKPFSDDTIDEPNVVLSISEIFGKLLKTLRRLVIDMPLRSYYPDEDNGQGLRSVLRSAFLCLEVLEEFVSIRDELYLSTMVPSNYEMEPPVWSKWRSLQRLALYNLDIHKPLSKFFNAMPGLKTIMLTRPDTEEDVDESSHNWNADLHISIVNTWRDHIDSYRDGLDCSSRNLFGTATVHRIFRTQPAEQSRPLPVLDIICVDGQNPFKEARGSQRNQLVSTWQRSSSSNWAAYDLRNTINDIRICQDWVRSSALSGNLWPDVVPNPLPVPNEPFADTAEL